MKAPDHVIPANKKKEPIEQVVTFMNKLDKPITSKVLSNNTHKIISPSNKVNLQESPTRTTLVKIGELSKYLWKVIKSED